MVIISFLSFFFFYLLGHQCDMCIDGYFGDPLGRFGAPRPCRKCECNGNIDPNAVGNCNT